MYCPNCRLEYRPGFSVCPDCSIELVTGLPPLPPKPPQVDHSDDPPRMVTVFESYALPQIAVAKSILEEAGISHISGNQLAEAAYFTGPSSIMVSRENAESARELLANLAMDHLLDEALDKMTFDDESDSGNDR